jgi:hypothetical protein
VCKKRTAAPPAAQHSSSEQKPDEPTVLATGLVLIVLDFLAFVVLASLPDQSGKKQAPQAPPSCHAADENTGQAAILVMAAFRLDAFFVLVDVVQALAVGFVPITK